MSTIKSMSGSPIVFTPADDQIYAILRLEIIRGALPPGAVLKLRDLAARFQVSTTPVREALDRLRGERLCVQESHRGTYVAPLSLPELQGIQVVRMALEGEAAFRGAAAIDTETIREIRSHWEGAQAVLHDRPLAVDDYLESLNRMYTACYIRSEAPRLTSLITDHRGYAERYLRFALRTPQSLRNDLTAQEAFVEACEKRDSAAAQTVIRGLLSWTVENVRDHLRPSDPLRH